MNRIVSNDGGKKSTIEIWRTQDIPELELIRGYGVARPVPRHWHEEYQFCLVQSGSGELCYRGNNLLTPPVSLFLVHPGEVHSNRAFETTGCSYRTIFVDVALMSRMARDLDCSRKEAPFFPTAVVFDQAILAQYLTVHQALERPASRLERQSLFLEFLSTLIPRFAENPRAPRNVRPDRQVFSDVRDYMIAHFPENISLQHLAQKANLSPFHFNRAFSEYFGIPPHEFQTQLRVCRARLLLRQGWSILHAAIQTGFADQSHLTRHFKRLVGVTPGQYRKSNASPK